MKVEYVRDHADDQYPQPFDVIVMIEGYHSEITVYATSLDEHLKRHWFAVPGRMIGWALKIMWRNFKLRLRGMKPPQYERVEEALKR